MKWRSKDFAAKMAEIKTEPLAEYYEVKEELGRGRFAVVKRCVKISTGEVFAAKCIRKARAGRRGREQLLLEIDILYRSNHPKLVKLYDVFETRSEMILILEYAAGGDLHKHCLEQMDSVRTEKEICSLIYQIVEAARYLHDNNVVHLDLKPENILLKNDQRFPEIRLIDFGLSRRVDLPYSQYDIVGTPEYVAPEVLAYEPIELSADLWSIGVVTYVLLSGISPFAGDDIMETYSNISNVDYDFDAEEFDDISEEAKDFVECLLIKDPKERLKIKECLEHPWMKQMEQGVKEEDIFEVIKAEKAFNTLTKQASIPEVAECDEEDVFSSENEEKEEVACNSTSEEEKDESESCEEVGEIVEVQPPVKSHEEEVIPSEVSVNKDEALPEKVCVNNGISDQNKPDMIDMKKSESEEVLKKPSIGLFDIDSLLCNDENDDTNTVNQNKEEIVSENHGEIEIKSEDIKPSDSIEINKSLNSVESIEISNSNIAENEKTVSPVIDAFVRENSDEVAEITNKIESDFNANENASDVKNKIENKEESYEMQVSNISYQENGSLKGIYKKQRSSDAAIQQKPSFEDATVRSYNGTSKESKTLVKMKSVDENMLGGRKKNSDAGKNKLGAHLEKLSKAGLNFNNSENDLYKPGPMIVKQGSTRRHNSAEKIVIDTAPSYLPSKDVSVGEQQQKTSTQSSRSSGSRTPSSGQGTPDSGRGTPTAVILQPPPQTVNSGKDVMIAPLTKQTDEKSTFAKRPPASKTPLGVRQGIAAQMASKFANAEKKESQTNTPGKANKAGSPQHRISNKKVFDYQGSGTRSPENVVSRSPQMSPIIDRAKKFINASAANQDERKHPKESPKFERAAKFSDLQKKVKDAGEQKVADKVCGNEKAQTKPQSKTRELRKDECQVDGGLKKSKSKENIIQKFERKIKNDPDQDENKHQVIVQPKGLQINFSLQASNKFKPKEVNVPIQRDPSPNKWEAKLSKEKPLKFKFAENEKQNAINVPIPADSILGQDHDFNHVEHTAIGAIATMPRTPLRDLRGKSRTSRDRGDGSPSSPRKSYRRLYVTHVRGSKSEQEADTAEDFAEFKTKVEKDELKVELLVKFPEIKFGTL